MPATENRTFKDRAFCPNCGGRQMSETAALLVDEVLPRVPVRQWVLSLPVALRYLLAKRPAEITRVLGVVWRAIVLPLSLSTSDCGVN